MTKFYIEIREIQHWSYVYAVEANSSDQALHIAESKHFAGEQAYDNWINNSTIENTFVKENQNA